MTLSALLDQLAGAGVRIRMAGPDRLEVSAPRGALTGELRQLIAQHKPELVDWLARVPGSPDEAAVPQVRPAPQDARLPFPPSDLQVSFLVGSHGGLELTVRPHQYYEWDLADLDPGRWAGALNAALHRQRANIVVVREDLQLQAVDDPGPVPVPVLDLRGLPEADARAELERVRAEMSGGELPLDRWPWLEARITRYGDDRVRLHYNHNNFFVDGVSLGRLLADVRHGYEHPDEPLPPVHLTYRDCVLALADLEASPEGRAAERYWRDRLPGLPVAPELPRTASDARGRSELERREQVLPRHSWDAVKRRAADRGLTPTAAAFAAYAEVVAYWSGSRHFLLNMMVTHRIPMHPQIRELFGNFAALYPLEVDWRPDEPFADRVSRLSARVMADLAQTSWSGTKVLQALNQVRGTPGVAVCPYVVGSGLFMGSLDRPDFSRLETPQVVLDCQFWEQADGSLWLVWDLVEALFPDGVAGAMQDAFRSLLERLAAGDAAWEARTPELLPAGQAEQRRRLNAVTAPVPDGLLHDGLAGRAAERPDRPCVVAADRTLDYGETARRSAALAGLLRDRGMTPGDLVAVVLPKGWEQVVAVFAVLAAGGAYVPVDPAWPDERVRHLLAETRAGAVLTGRPLADRLAGLTAAPVLPVDPADPGQAPPPAQAPRDPDDLAYVIYTSGSTGRPKGAMLSHRGPLNTVLDINRRFAVGPDDVLLGVSSLCFDLSVYDVFGAVAAGATLVLPAPDGDGPAGWLDLVRRHGVTVWNSVPALMELVVDEAEAAGVQLTSLRTVLLSGDWMPVGLPGRIRRVAPRARVVSLGGATEASIWSIAHPVEPADQDRVSIPYGRPLANQTWHVLDDRGRDAPTWVAGELYIGGAGVALGYLHDPERTAAAFVAHPRTGERLYRTGDRGRYLPGRRDRVPRPRRPPGQDPGLPGRAGGGGARARRAPGGPAGRRGRPVDAVRAAARRVRGRSRPGRAAGPRRPPGVPGRPVAGLPRPEPPGRPRAGPADRQRQGRPGGAGAAGHGRAGGAARARPAEDGDRAGARQGLGGGAGGRSGRGARRLLRARRPVLRRAADDRAAAPAAAPAGAHRRAARAPHGRGAGRLARRRGRAVVAAGAAARGSRDRPVVPRPPGRRRRAVLPRAGRTGAAQLLRLPGSRPRRRTAAAAGRRRARPPVRRRAAGGATPRSRTCWPAGRPGDRSRSPWPTCWSGRAARCGGCSCWTRPRRPSPLRPRWTRSPSCCGSPRTCSAASTPVRWTRPRSGSCARCRPVSGSSASWRWPGARAPTTRPSWPAPTPSSAASSGRCGATGRRASRRTSACCGRRRVGSRSSTTTRTAPTPTGAGAG